MYQPERAAVGGAHGVVFDAEWERRATKRLGPVVGSSFGRSWKVLSCTSVPEAFTRGASGCSGRYQRTTPLRRLGFAIPAVLRDYVKRGLLPTACPTAAHASKDGMRYEELDLYTAIDDTPTSTASTKRSARAWGS